MKTSPVLVPPPAPIAVAFTSILSIPRTSTPIALAFESTRIRTLPWPVAMTGRRVCVAMVLVGTWWRCCGSAGEVLVVLEEEDVPDVGREQSADCSTVASGVL